VRRILALGVLIVGLGFVTSAIGSSPVETFGLSASARHVRVARCPTQFGIPPGRISVPTTVAVRGAPSSTKGLIAYTNTELFLIAPAHMACSGTIGADGNASLAVWPRGQRRPRKHSRGGGVTLTVIPACVGCMAFVACPFFPSFARRLGFPCASGIPAGEVVRRPNRQLALFEDPPGIAGDGWPSGGPNPARGLVGIKGRHGFVYSATCTLPASKRHACAVGLDDVRARYG
jgi:hypothetical protein